MNTAMIVAMMLCSMRKFRRHTGSAADLGNKFL